MNYFYIGCQLSKCMTLHAHCQPATSQPSVFPSPLIPSTSQARTLCRVPGKGARKKAWAGDTRGLPFLSVTETPCPARALDPPAIVFSFSSTALCWAAVRIAQWPADLREKTDVPINFCQNVITSGLENHMGVGRERNRCITFKYAIAILQKFK